MPRLTGEQIQKCKAIKTDSPTPILANKLVNSRLTTRQTYALKFIASVRDNLYLHHLCYRKKKNFYPDWN
ncbi:hypothetical protein V462_13885 [Pantoea ananatis 15320]|nr:hypothetical protein V462_13885 [Pantoea ananatis 15320]